MALSWSDVLTLSVVTIIRLVRTENWCVGVTKSERTEQIWTLLYRHDFICSTSGWTCTTIEIYSQHRQRGWKIIYLCVYKANVGMLHSWYGSKNLSQADLPSVKNNDLHSMKLAISVRIAWYQPHGQCRAVSLANTIVQRCHPA